MVCREGVTFGDLVGCWRNHSDAAASPKTKVNTTDNKECFEGFTIVESVELRSGGEAFS